MAVLDWINTARDDTFAARVSMTLMTLAINVMNEDAGTTNHANRLALAEKHLKNGVNCKSIAAAVIAFNTTTQTNITAFPSLLGSNVPDADMQFVLGGLYNNIANAYAASV